MFAGKISTIQVDNRIIFPPASYQPNFSLNENYFALQFHKV